MHSTQREQAIINLLLPDSYVSFRELATKLGFPQPTLRHDLQRLEKAGLIERVHGAARLAGGVADNVGGRLTGAPFQQNIGLHAEQKQAIGRAAAALCRPGEAVMIDGGSTTLQMCAHLDGLGLQVLTNSLHIVSALLPQASTRIMLPGGSLFREQNIILSALGDDLLPKVHAPKFFMGAAAVGPRGVMQPDVVLVAAERGLIQRADELILLVDSSKFESSSGNVVCDLNEVDVIITDAGIDNAHRKMIEAAGIRLIIAD